MSHHELDRYVIDVATESPLDRDGFLVLDGTTSWWFQISDDQPEPIRGLAGSARSFVLLAPPYAGKSTVMARLRSLEPGATEVNLRTHDFRDISELLSAAIARGKPVYLDALDEAAIYAPRIFRLLEERLAEPDASSIPWRLACRPTAWNSSLSQRLRGALPEFQELRLLPLHRGAARELIAEFSRDPDALLGALTRAGLGRLAATPQRLKTAAQEGDRTGRVPESALEAIDLELDQLLAEPDSGRPQPRLGVDGMRRIAGRLAAIAIFCRSQAFAMGAEAGPNVLAVGALPSAAEPDEPGASIGRPEYEAVLATALFDASAGSTVVFRHHQYAEYLAAGYLVQRGASSRQVRELLALSDDGLVPSPLVGVSAWITALDPSLTTDLVAQNALAFIRSGVEMPSDSVRAAVVEAALDLAETGDIDPEWSLELASLKHAGLLDQLRASVGRGIGSPQHFWWIAKLAVAGDCRALIELLLERTLGSRWPDWARGAGVDAVARLGARAQREQLRVLLSLSQLEDPDDALLADAIEGLYPDILTTTELLEALRPRRNDHLIGGYLIILGKLADVIPEGDLAEALEWLSNRPSEADNDDFGRLPQQLIVRGWRLSASEPVLRGLASAVAGLARRHASFDFFRRDVPPWATADAERRRLAVAVAQEIGTETGWFDLVDMRLIAAVDVIWLLDELPDLPEPAQPPLAACVPGLIQEPTSEIARRVMALPPDHPAYGPTAYLREPVSLDSETAQLWRRHSQRRADETNESSPANTRESLLSALAEAEREPDEWWNVVLWLSVEEHGQVGQSLFSDDLSNRPQWHLLDDQERARVLESGYAHVKVHQLQLERWRGQRTVQQDALRDWAGVYLMATFADCDAQRLDGLDTAIWVRWAPAIAGAWHYGPNDNNRLRVGLVQRAPEAARAAIAQEVLALLDMAGEDSISATTRSLLGELMDELALPVTEWVRGGRLAPRATDEVLEVLADARPSIAIGLCRDLRRSDDLRLRASAARHLARIDVGYIVDELVTGPSSDQEILDTVPHVNIRTLDASRLASLAHLLLDRFPFDSDPAMPIVSIGHDQAYETRNMRGSILNLLTELGETARLEWLAIDRPEPDQAILRQRIRTSRIHAADLAFDPLRPEGLLALLSRADARLVRSDGDLVEVVIDQVADLQTALRRGAFRDLWNEAAAGSSHPKHEDDISDWLQRHLEISLDRGTIVDREVQVSRPHPGGIGTRIDIAATQTTRTHPAIVARVTVEAKLVNNPELRTPLADQLVERYLRPTNRRHGIYLVYWVAPDQRPPGWGRQLSSGLAELEAELQSQAAGLAPEFIVRPVILDISRPG